MNTPFQIVLFVKSHSDGHTISLVATTLPDMEGPFDREFSGAEAESIIDNLGEFFQWVEGVTGALSTEAEILVYDKAALTALLGQQGTADTFLHEGLTDLESYFIGAMRSHYTPAEARKMLKSIVFDYSTPVEVVTGLAGALTVCFAQE